MLKGKKVVLDVIDPEDIEWMRQQRNNPEMRKHFREWKEISKAQQEWWYNNRGNNTNPNHVYFKILEADHMVLVGCLGLHYIDWRLGSAEFGIFLSKEARGKGIGKEALFMLCDYGFKEMNLHKIWCEVYSSNRSAILYRKLGFKDDGILRDSHFCDGKYGNSIMMSVLENEWFDLHGGK
jgi:hypothetical protein